MSKQQRIAAYIRPWTEAYYRFFIPKAFPNSTPLLLSDWKGFGEFDLSGAFYEQMRRPAEDVAIPNWLDYKVEHEIILRNLLLRSMPVDKASRLLRAMSRAIEISLDRLRPDAFLSPAVDSYVMDLLLRHCVARGIPYCGMLPCPIPGYTRPTAVGEHLAFRNPSAQEIDAAIEKIANPHFTPVDLTEWLKMYGSNKVYLKRALRELPKKYVFPVIGRVKNDPLNYHYLASARSSVSFVSQSLLVHRYFDDAWLAKLKSWKGTKVYIPLQAFPECTTDYHVREMDLIDFPRVLPRLVDRLGDDPNILICLKEHPGMMGARPPGFYDALLKRKNVLLLSGDVPASSLIAETDVLVTWTGTGGLECLLRGKPVVTLGRPYYSHGKSVANVLDLDSLDCVAQTVNQMRRQAVDMDDKRAIARHVLAGTLPGEYRFIRFDPQNVSLVSDAASLARGTSENWKAWSSAFASHHADQWPKSPLPSALSTMLSQEPTV